jgi:glycosyltransferase involved in cell wall biosynthesis
MAPAAEARAEAGRPLTIAVCAPQVPFVSGGAEDLVASLCRELRARGHRVELVTLPYKWYPRAQLWRSMKMWEMADLRESNDLKVDLVIATKFPSYFVRHGRKVLWLIHQYRQLYDLYGTPYTEYTPNRWRDRRLHRRFVARDTAALARFTKRFTISDNTRQRMYRYNGLASETLYPPPKLADRLQCREYGDFVLSVGRLDQLKRTEGLIRALAQTKSAVRAVIAGTGPEERALKQLTRDLGLAARVEFPGYVDDAGLVDLYGRCLAVLFAPLDEDYGYVTLEAFLAAKPVLTCSDSGGSLEFVAHERNGFILPPGDWTSAAVCVDRLYRDRELSRSLGEAGRAAVRGITWDHVLARLLEGAA